MNVRTLLLVPTLLLACAEDPRMSPEGSGDAGPRHPQQGDWHVDRFQFVHADGQISGLRIGGSQFDFNFINRGDITVVYDAKPDTLVVEWRPFATSTSERIEGELARLTPWYADQNFDRPTLADAAESSGRCGPNVWTDGCGIRAHYDGRSQTARSGIDFRVHLPPDFVGKLEVTTEDNVRDDDYQNRGNVCLWDLPGSANIEVEQGLVFVKLADSLQATPTCPAADIEACHADGWSTACPCITDSHGFGQLSINAIKSDIVIDITPGVWTRWVADTPTAGECVATIDVVGAELDGSDAQAASGQAEYPPGATAGGGYFVRAESDDCGSVTYTQDPDLFVAGSKGSVDPRRGDITICENCIRATSCENLLANA
ncbi:MAG: hypothetical protein JKY37_11130, partial [Nannocystaceae bacterium]|nr:hypothetical protein [Nannocystaceae bacterium]